ncbi:HAMP domain-containing protein [Pseudenhygromyxa sp. WMMC2535]|uniref:sensor histidine kinase n=1 Tax=Pseudenhygromyxa sp. WMMC2535 TaxID=2712867 RepID=UPI00155430C8|nr:HAMP domain-containing sensor histidine kinase [Pseudenhygromyxa sp. WMMC2535]NVB40488.1 HAMP domain-containing protein [Pseudenhygromyxa sp. WMMC2535]
MRVALKILIVMVALVIMVLAVEAGLRSRREASIYEQDLRRDQRILGRALREAAELTWRERDLAAAERVVEVAAEGEHEVAVRVLHGDQVHGELESLVELAPTEFPPELEGDLFQFSREDALVTVIPLEGPDGREIGLELSTPLADGREHLAKGMRRFAEVAGFLLLTTSLIGVAAGRWMVGRPIQALVAQTRSLAAGEFVHSDLSQLDEIGELGRALDRTSDQLATAREALESETRQRLEAVENLRQADRLATLGTLAAGVAHELGTPLHVIAGRAQRVARRSRGEAVHADAQIIVEQCETVQGIVRGLLDFARPAKLERTAFEPLPMVRRTMTLVEPLLRKRKAEVRFMAPSADEPAWIEANLGQLQQVITNLLINAAQSMPEGGRIDLSVEHGLDPHPGAEADRPYTRISVRDHGDGMDPEVIDHIYDPFFTTKEPGEGTGLGLSIVYGIVREHGGWIEVESERGWGSRFCVWLPEIDAPTDEDKAKDAADQPKGVA